MPQEWTAVPQGKAEMERAAFAAPSRILCRALAVQ